MPEPTDPQEVFERAFALGQLDPFDFMLAHDLGMTVERLHAEMSNREYVQWRAWYVWREGQRMREVDPDG
jgi:hypothetical protein